MDRAIIDEILEELSSTLQRVEAQSSAILEFVKEKGIVKEDELAPYIERANAASNVRWRATRVRLEKLLSGLEKKQQQEEQQKHEERKEAGQKKDQPAQKAGKSEAKNGSEPKGTAEPKKAEAERASEPKATEQPREAEVEKTSESKPAAKREPEKAPAEPSQSRSSDEKLASSPGKQPPRTDRANNSGEIREQQQSSPATSNEPRNPPHNSNPPKAA